MSCVVSYINPDGSIVMGSDSVGADDYNKEVFERVDEKVFVKGDMIFGFVGSFRVGQLVRYKFKIPKRLNSCKSDHEYMCTTFVDELKKCLVDNHSVRTVDGEASCGEMLVGYNGAVYCIDGDYHVGIYATDYMSIGIGSAHALGALHTLTYNKQLSTETRVKRALEASILFNAYVMEPIVIKKLDA